MGFIEITGTFGPTGATAGSPAGFATHESNFGLGGYMQVADITERDAITTLRRVQGMACWVVSENKLYILKTGLTNTDWVELTAGGGGGSIDVTDGTTTISAADEIDFIGDIFTLKTPVTGSKAEVEAKYNTNINPATAVATTESYLQSLTAADFVGLDIVAVFNKILFPTQNPVYFPPTSSLVDSVSTIVEIGSSVSNNLTLTLIKNDSGGIDTGTPANITSSESGSLTLSPLSTIPQTNLSPQFGYANANNPNEKYTYTATDNFTMPGSGTVSYTSSISYLGGNQLKDSTGADAGTAIVAGSFTPSNGGVSGVYPWFWGLSTSSWSDYATAVAEVVAEIQNPAGSANKEIEGSNNTITAAFNGSAGVDFMWFATPATSNDKTVWYENALNNGLIGGTSFSDPTRNLFSAPSTQAITTSLWSGINYKVYVALKSSDTTTLQLKNN